MRNESAEALGWDFARDALRARTESITVTETLTALPFVVSDVFDTVVARNPHEPEFQQAVHEVLGSIAPVLDAHPRFVDGGIVERIV